MHSGSSDTRGRRSRRRRGFTLVEITIALLLAGFVLSALSSVILLGAQAIPDEEGAQNSAIYAADALEKLSTELAVARQVNSIGATGVEFTVADWTGDATDETIRYAWGGTPGDPILRDVNGSGAVALVPAAESFALTTVQASQDIRVDSRVNERTNQLVQELDAAVMNARWVSSEELVAQRIVPDLPADCTSWRIDDIEVVLWGTANSTDLDSGVITVEIRGINPKTLQPNSDVYATARSGTGGLSQTYQSAVYFRFKCPDLRPDVDLCFVVRGASGRSTAGVHWHQPYTSRGTRYAYYSNNAGADWSTASSYIVDSEVYATVRTQSETKVTRTTLTEVRAEVTLGDASIPFERAIRLLNTPEVK